MEKSVKILVSGSRLVYDPAFVGGKILECLNDRGFENLDKLYVVHGGAEGIDKSAKDWCSIDDVFEDVPYPADWDRYGPAAGPIRNSEMLKREPDIALLIAFPGKNSVGTYDMIEKAERRNIETIIFEVEE